MPYVYILQSLKDNRTYVGFTDNIDRRLAEHNGGRVPSTHKRVPFKILFAEHFETSAEAKNREIWWKSGAGRRELKKRFASNFWTK